MELEFKLCENTQKCRYGALLLDFVHSPHTLETIYSDDPKYLDGYGIGYAYWPIPVNRDMFWLRQILVIENLRQPDATYANLFSQFFRSRDRTKIYDLIKQMLREGEEEDFDQAECGFTYEFSSKRWSMGRKKKLPVKTTSGDGKTPLSQKTLPDDEGTSLAYDIPDDDEYYDAGDASDDSSSDE